MGNRAVVVFTDGEEHSPAIYLHWGGGDVPKLLAATRERMKGRDGDLSYAAARFIGIAHTLSDGNTGLGVWNMEGDPREQCPGDAGVFLVNVKTWGVQRLTGRLGECDAPREFSAGAVTFTAEQLATMGDE